MKTQLERRLFVYEAHIDTRNEQRERHAHLADLPDWWPGSVYFAQAIEGGPIKIGFTARPLAERLRELQTSSPATLRMLAEIPNADAGLERRLHNDFGDRRLHSEWFTPNELLEGIVAHYAGAAA